VTESAGRTGRKVLVAVTGSIAAYKAAELVSRLCSAGHEVRVVMTECATRFISPLTFRSLTGAPVYAGMWEDGTNWDIRHISLARFADVVVVAPATARTIARLALALADELVSCTVLACRAPVIVAPAMNEAMWTHPAVQANVEKLRSMGYCIVEPEEGRLACGLTGKGRLAAVGKILEKIEEKLT